MAAPTNDRATNRYIHREVGEKPVKYPLALWSPGLGRTTLAHVIAKHCGYRVINASDDRSSSTIEAKILDVVRMNSSWRFKPNCLVIDEIDGALGDGKGVVEVILKCCTPRQGNYNETLSFLIISTMPIHEPISMRFTFLFNRQ
ncbi:hypothetical protein AAG906_018824 [Vitis piasezkii]